MHESCPCGVNSDEEGQGQEERRQQEAGLEQARGEDTNLIEPQTRGGGAKCAGPGYARRTPNLAAQRSSGDGGVEANAVSATAHALITEQGV